MTKIEQLESEINQKIKQLNESLNVQYVLRERLKSNTKTMEGVKNQLKGIEAYLEYSDEFIYMLTQDNWSLKLSYDEWVKRSTKLELEALSACDVTKNRN